MNTESKVRWLAEQAGWEPDDCDCDYPECSWKGFFRKGTLVDRVDYEHSLDAIARDLLPLLREKGMQYSLYWNGHDHGLVVWDSDGAEIGTAQYPAEPAAVAFEAIYEALRLEV